MEKKTKNNKLLQYYLIYSVIFIGMVWVVFHYFFEANLSFVWKVDGWTQHVKALSYCSNWLQQIAKGVLYKHKLEIPLWSPSIGYGNDIITVLNYYAIGDPINLLSIFTPDSKIGTCYSLLVLLRIYLSGITFSAYCFYMKRDKHLAVLIGTYVYIFSGYVFLHGMRHPYFINACIYLPLLLLGVERILKERKSLLFIIAVFLSAVSNFYFFYMLVLLTIIYVIFRVLAIYDIKNIKEAVKSVGNIFISSVAGVCLSAVIFLPVILLFLDTERSKVKRSFDLFYDHEFFDSFVKGFMSAQFIGKHTGLCYASIALLCIIMLFFQKGHNSLKIAVPLFTLFLCMPYVGHIFNGFSYASNRWMFAYSMLLAFIVATVMQDIKKINLVSLICCTIFLVFYVIKTNEPGTSFVEREIRIAVFIGFIQLALLMGFWLFTRIFKFGRKYEGTISAVVSMMILVLLLMNIAKNGESYLVERKNNVFSEYKTVSEVDGGKDLLIDQAVKKAAAGDTDTFWRYSGSYDCIMRNSTLHSGLKSTASYWSLTPGNLSEFMQEQDLFTGESYNFRGVDDRTFLNELVSVKYFVTFADKNKQNVPYGYESMDKQENSGQKYTIYKNKNPLPLGYTYSSYIPKKHYNQLFSLDRQNAMLQGIVLDKDLKGYDETKVDESKKSIAYTMSMDKEIENKGKSFIVKKKGAAITLSFEGNRDCETYLYIKNMKMGQEVKKGKYSRKANIVVKSTDEQNKTNTKSVMYLSRNHQWYSGRHSFLANFGYNKNAQKKITISFRKKGIYSFEDLGVYTQGMENYDKRVNALKEDTLQNVKFLCNKISGNISLNNKKILCLSIPYSKGWTAYVDGKKQEILQANTMFMALPLSEGTHSIVLRYCTPGLKAGIAISCVGVALCIIICIQEKKNRSK